MYTHSHNQTRAQPSTVVPRSKVRVIQKPCDSFPTERENKRLQRRGRADGKWGKQKGRSPEEKREFDDSVQNFAKSDK